MRKTEPIQFRPDEHTPSAHNQSTVGTHPAFGSITAARVSGSSYLYGSEFRHDGFIDIEICHSEFKRDLSRDWHYSRDPICRVSMSEAQWAHFVSSLNVGSGTQCTLKYIGREEIPAIEEIPQRSRQFKSEIAETLSAAQKHLSQLRAQIEESKLSGKQKKQLADSLRMAQMNISSNLEFVAQSFGEHMEEVTESAKVEIEAHIHGQINRAGLQLLQGEGNMQLRPPITLDAPDDPK